MIIIIGPDDSGKTTLAQKFDLQYYHFTKGSSYQDYLVPLTKLQLYDAVLDRCPICEYPYHIAMGRKFLFSMKEWHNLLLLTLMQNPVVILCTHKPMEFQYSRDQYLPYHKWDECLALYRKFLNTHHITHIEYNYTISGPTSDALALLESRYRGQMSWWKPMWEKGYGAIGSPHPKVLIVAERIGPNNVNNLPFETGPTGRMLTDMFRVTGTPLGKVAITNLVKSFRRDSRPPNQGDLDLLRIELEHLKPEKILFMGSVSKQGIKVANELGIPHTYLPHLGYYHHQGITDMTGYHAQWRELMNMVPRLEFK